MIPEKNPHADPDGSPVKGEEAQFFAWEKDHARLNMNTDNTAENTPANTRDEEAANGHPEKN